MVLLGDEAQVEACFGPLGDSANLEADRCMVCAKHTIGSEIILDTPHATHSYVTRFKWKLISVR